MPFSINVRNTGGISVIEIVGRVVMGDRLQDLRRTIEELVKTGEKNVILDLAGVSYVDSSGFGEIVWIYTKLKGVGGTLALASLTSKAKDLLQMTKLLTIFDVFENADAAVSALISRRKVTS
jgi:anti-sigma B factor antagonist